MSLFNKKLRLKILGDDVLLKKCSPVPMGDIKKKDFQNFIDGMISTMKNDNGVGLAAPQVGELKRVFVVEKKISEEIEKNIHVTHDVFINPEIVERSSEEVIGLEGCLSIPTLFGDVPRSRSIKVRAFDRQGKYFEIDIENFYARVVQHEYDHLDGVLFLNRMRDLNTLRMEF